MKRQELHRPRATRACPQCANGVSPKTVSPGHRPASQQRRGPGHQPMRMHGRLDIGDLGIAAYQASDRRTQIPRIRVHSTQWRKVRPQARRFQLKHRDRVGQVPQPSRSQIEKINTGEQHRRRIGQKDLSTVSSGHYPCGAIQHCTEIIPVPQIGLTGRNAHPHRQLQRPLRSDRGVDGRLRRRERRRHTIAIVAEQKTVVRLDRGAQHLVMRLKGRPHRIRVGLPPTGRPLNIGDQKRHNPRRRNPSGHSHRISHRAHPTRPTATDFDTRQAAYSQLTFRNPLWDDKIRKILRRPISRRSISG